MTSTHENLESGAKSLSESSVTKNIILFGLSGVGKSSVVNMLTGVGDNPNVSVTSSSARGVTFAAASYLKNINGIYVKVHDTSGLNEGSQGTVSGVEAIKALHKLIMATPPEGISLLVYVIRVGRITIMTKLNYDMFYDTICHKQVKIVLIVTGLEGEDMDVWWPENEEAFREYNLLFSGQACITALPSHALYQSSKRKVEDLIYTALADVTPWIPSSSAWLADFLGKYIDLSSSAAGSHILRELSPELKMAISSYIAVSGNFGSTARHQRRKDQANPPDIVVLAIGTQASLDSINIPAEHHIQLRTHTLSDVGDKMEDLIIDMHDALRRVKTRIHLLVLVLSDKEIEDDRWPTIYEVLFRGFLQKNVPISYVINVSESSERDWSHIFDGKNMYFQSHLARLTKRLHNSPTKSVIRNAYGAYQSTHSELTEVNGSVSKMLGDRYDNCEIEPSTMHATRRSSTHKDVTTSANNQVTSGNTYTVADSNQFTVPKNLPQPSTNSSKDDYSRVRPNDERDPFVRMVKHSYTPVPFNIAFRTGIFSILEQLMGASNMTIASELLDALVKHTNLTNEEARAAVKRRRRTAQSKAPNFC